MNQPLSPPTSFTKPLEGHTIVLKIFVSKQQSIIIIIIIIIISSSNQPPKKIHHPKCLSVVFSFGFSVLFLGAQFLDLTTSPCWVWAQTGRTSAFSADPKGPKTAGKKSAEPSVEQLHRWRFKKRHTLPKFNSSPLKSYLPNRKVVFQPSFSRGYVKLQGGNFEQQKSRANIEFWALKWTGVQKSVMNSSTWKLWLDFDAAI